MFLRMKLPWQKKVPLVLIFSLGIFVILAAVLNKVYSFSQPFGGMWSFWYVRESSTAMLVANLPFVWQVWRKITRFDTIAGATRRLTTNHDSGDSPIPERSNTINRPPKDSTLNLAGLAEWPSESEPRGHDIEKNLQRYGSWKQHDQGRQMSQNPSEDNPYRLGLSPWKSEGAVPSPPRDRAVLKDKWSRFGSLRRESDVPRRHSVSGSSAPASLEKSNSADSFV